MIETWYVILTLMLILFVVLEGFDIGAGMLQYLVGKTEAERRMVIAAIGPLWSWHEVWLIGFGGTLLVAFPAIFAASFSGFYLAFFLLLWAILLRGVSIEVSGHLADPLWRTAWHTLFVGANGLLAILIGAALGNVLRGVPVGADGKFALAFFTDFSPAGKVGILDWYTVSVAVFVLATFAAHGASGLVRRTDGPVNERSYRVAGRLWIAVFLLLIVVSIETWHVRPELFANMIVRPWGWLGLACVFGGLIGILVAWRRKFEGALLLSSGVFITGLMIAGSAGAFPIMLHSTLRPEFSLSAYQNAGGSYGLGIALVWWPLAFIFSIGYFIFVYRYYSSKVKPAQDTQNPY